MINKVIIIGNVGRDPEVRYTKSGQVVADLRVATNERWKDKQGNRQEHTEWHSVVLWGQQAEFAQNYAKKGRLVFVEGRLQTRDWTDNQNVKHYKTEIVANNLRLLDRPADSPGAGAPAGGAAARSGGAPRAAQGGGQGGGPDYEDYGPPGGAGASAGEPDESYIEDDIPF
jgi:single-strand DNA-binding protein